MARVATASATVVRAMRIDGPPKLHYVEPSFFGEPEAWSAALFLRFMPWSAGEDACFKAWCMSGLRGPVIEMGAPLHREPLVMPRPIYREVTRRAAMNGRGVGDEAAVVLRAGLAPARDDALVAPLVEATYFKPTALRRIRDQRFVRRAQVTLDTVSAHALYQIVCRLGIGVEVAAGMVLLRGILRLGTGLFTDGAGDAWRAQGRTIDYRMAKVARVCGETMSLHMANRLPDRETDQSFEIAEEIDYIRWIDSQAPTFQAYAIRRNNAREYAQALRRDERAAELAAALHDSEVL